MIGASRSNTQPLEPSESASRENPPWYRELAALLATLGVVIVIGVVDLLVQGQKPTYRAALASWIWVFDLILTILAIVIVISVVRLIFRGVRGTSHREYRERRHRRRGLERAISDRDPAVELARERFARGEISREQLDQMMIHLGKGS